MSWGYFANLRISIDSAAWKGLEAGKPGDVALAAGWSGLAEKALENAFGTPNTKSETFAQVLGWKAYRGAAAIRRIETSETSGERTTVRMCLLLDKSLLDLAFPLVALFHRAARDPSAEGTLELVNDGTYGGEDGITLTLAKGKITKTKIDDCSALALDLGRELFETNVVDRAKPKINPFTGKPI